MNKYNTVGKRIGASIIDGLVFLPFSFIDTFAVINKFYFFLVGVLYLLLWSIYTITLHSFYGQTLGKKITGVKLYNVNESSLISLKKSFLRESIWVAGQLIILIFFTAKMFNNQQSKEEVFDSYSDSAALFTIFWTVIELISMLTNSKKRSIQDFIANSVVLKN